MSSFFPSDEMSIISWIKLELTLANTDLLLFTKGAFHGQKGYQGNLGLHHPPTPPRLPILLLFWGTVFLIRVTLGYQHMAQGTHLPQGYLGNLFARETLPNTPAHCAKPLHEWVQYLLHQRTKTRNLAKTQRQVDTAGGFTLTSASDHAEYHLTEQFLQFVSTICKVMEAPDVTSFAIWVAVMSAGLPLLCQWISGMPVNLSGHAIYKELAPHRLQGGKTMMRDLAEFVGEVICTYDELDMPLKAVVSSQVPVPGHGSHCDACW